MGETLKPLSDELDAVKGYNTKKIDVSQLAQGTYLMQVNTDKESYTEVVMIIRNE